MFILIIFIGFIAGYIASPLPDGLEWSIINTYGGEIEAPSNTIAIMPDYNHSFAGLLGSLVIILIIYALGKFINRKQSP